MLPSLLPHHYLDEYVFREEVARIFLKSWLFVGYTFDLEAPASWFTFELFGRSYFVQRDGEALHCFVNACSHRHSRLRTETCGAGTIVCPYHGWMYKNDGSVNAIPRKPKFSDVTSEDLEELRLHSLQVTTWGPLIFVKIDPSGPSWEEFMGPAFERMTPLLNSIGTFRRRLQRTVKANWKAVIENSAEAYHIDCVHPTTFGQLDLQSAQFEYFGRHSLLKAMIGAQGLQKNARVNKLLGKRAYQTDYYEHAILFPNFGLSSMMGINFIVEQFLPVSADCTTYTLDFFGCDIPEASESTLSKANALLEYSFSFTKALNEEDTQIVEIQHKGMASAHSAGRLSEEEEMIYFLQQHWTQFNQQTNLTQT
jgi:phenylpropionate dioxygenase-like ring-hydroxylating dioxygenase large terminal subunit